MLNDAAISVNRCVWGPDGLMLGTNTPLFLLTSLFPYFHITFFRLKFYVLNGLGVAFSKHIVQIYTYNPTGELRQHLEVSPLPTYYDSPDNGKVLIIDNLIF